MKIYGRLAVYFVVGWIIPILIYVLYDGSLAGMWWAIIVTSGGAVIEIIFLIQNQIRDRKAKKLRKQ